MTGAAPIRLTLAAGLLGLIPGALAALTPPLSCQTAGTPEAAWHDYDVAHWNDGFVSYQLIDRDERTTMVVENCHSGQRLTVRFPHAFTIENDAHMRANDQVDDAIWDALTDTQGYTLRQIGEIGERAGGAATLGQAAYQSCACRLYLEFND